MAEFLTTAAIANRIEDVIKKARGKLVLVSPYLQLSATVLQRLKDAEKETSRSRSSMGKRTSAQSNRRC